MAQPKPKPQKVALQALEACMPLTQYDDPPEDIVYAWLSHKLPVQPITDWLTPHHLYLLEEAQDVNFPKKLSLNPLFDRAHSYGWRHPNPDWKPEAERTTKKSKPINDASNRAAGGAAQPSAPIGTLPTVGWDGLTDQNAAAWFLQTHQQDLVIIPPVQDQHPGAVYGFDHRGMLDGRDSYIQHLMTTAGERYNSAVYTSGLEAKEFGACAKHARRMQDSAPQQSLLKAVLTLASSPRISQFTQLIVAKPDDIDTDMSVIGTPDGVWCIRQMRLLSPAEARPHLVSASIPDPIDLKARCPLIDLLHPQELTTELRWFWNQLGYDITHPPTRHIVAQITKGGSGKTAWGNNICAGLGYQYTSNPRPEGFQLGRFSNGSQAHNGDLFDLAPPARIAIIQEAAGLEPRLLNQASGGEGRLTARDVREKRRRFTPTATLYIQANDPKPGQPVLNIGRTSDSDAAAALRDRLRLLPMPEVPEHLRDDRLREWAPKQAASRQAFMAILLRYAHDQLDAVSPPAGPESQKEALERLAKAESPDWLNDWLPGLFVPHDCQDLAVCGHRTANTRQAYDNFTGWWEDNAEPRTRKPAQKTITTALAAHYGPHGPDSKLPADPVSGKRRDTKYWPDLRFADDQ